MGSTNFYSWLAAVMASCSLGISIAAFRRSISDLARERKTLELIRIHQRSLVIIGAQLANLNVMVQRKVDRSELAKRVTSYFNEKLN